MTPLLIWAFAALAAALLLLVAAAGTAGRTGGRDGRRSGGPTADERFGLVTGAGPRRGHPSVGWLSASGAARDPRIAAAAWDGAARADRPVGR
jgi:hypothetical protein